MTTGAFSANGTIPKPLSTARQAGPSSTGFSILMTAALVAIIGLAAFGLVKNSIDFTLPGGDPDPTGAPGLAVSTAATPATGESCDLDNGVSIFEGSAPDIDGLGAFALLNDSGTLALHCGDTERELATGIREVVNRLAPQVVTLVTDDDQVLLLDLHDGTTLNLESDQLMTVSGEVTFQDAVLSGFGTPWLVTPVNADRTDWRITDLRSLDTILLSDELGGPLAAPQQPYIGGITNSDVTVVSWGKTPVVPEPTPAPGSQQLADHAALVLPGSIADRRWVDIYDWNQQKYEQLPSSQTFSASQDGELLAYTTLSDTFSPVIRIEHALDGTHVVDVPIDEIGIDTTFLLAGEKPHLVYSNGENVRIAAFVEGAPREIADFPSPHVQSMLPTADPDTVLISYSNTDTMPVNVTTGDAPEFYQYVPPIFFQVYGGAELPANIVRVDYASPGESDAVISLVNPATGEVVLHSDPIDQHPVEIISYPTWLRDGGTIAIVQVGPDRAIIMDANTQQIWETEAPDDAPLWNFFASPDGRFIFASPPKSNTWRTTYDTSYIAPLEPDAEWVPIESDSAVQGWQQWAQATPGT